MHPLCAHTGPYTQIPNPDLNLQVVHHAGQSFPTRTRSQGQLEHLAHHLQHSAYTKALAFARSAPLAPSPAPARIQVATPTA